MAEPLLKVNDEPAASPPVVATVLLSTNAPPLTVTAVPPPLPSTPVVPTRSVPLLIVVVPV